MVYTSDVIKWAISVGLRPGLVSGKKLVRLYLCHKCKHKSMIKAYGPSRKINACKCGYRKEF